MKCSRLCWLIVTHDAGKHLTPDVSHLKSESSRIFQILSWSKPIFLQPNGTKHEFNKAESTALCTVINKCLHAEMGHLQNSFD